MVTIGSPGPSHQRQQQVAGASPSRRRKREVPAIPTPCVDVQWRFLPRSVPTVASSPSASPLRRHGDRSAPTAAAQRAPSMRAILEDPGLRAERELEQERRRREQEQREREQQRVLQELLGETQRQAMLDQLVAEMQAITLGPRSPTSKRSAAAATSTSTNTVASSSSPSPASSSPHNRTHHPGRSVSFGPPVRAELLPQRRVSTLGSELMEGDDADASSDDGEGDDADAREDEDLPELRAIRDRHRRLLLRQESTRDSLEAAVASESGEPKILWQRSSRVRLAADIPAALLSGLEGGDEVTGPPGLAPRRSPNKRKSPSRSTASVPSPHSPPRRIRRAPYGSWYMPRGQWWPLHRIEQEQLAELYPDEQPPAPEHHHHCHHAPNQRQHKEPLPARAHAGDSDDDTGLGATLTARANPPRAMPRKTAVFTATVEALLSPRQPSRPPTSSSCSTRASCGSPPCTPSTTGRRLTSSSAIASNAGDGDPRARTPETPALTQRAREIQEELPRSYIAREYRNYIVSKGSRLPSYLNF